MQQDDRIFAVVGGCVIAAVALVAALIWLNSGVVVDPPRRAAVTVADQPAPQPATSQVAGRAVEQAVDTDNSANAIVRQAVARLSAHPSFAALLVSDRLLEQFVLAVDGVAGGYSPRDELGPLRPQRQFLVRETDGRLVPAAGTFHRYDQAADLVESISTAGAVDLYRRFQPRLEAIYADVGWAAESFDARLRQAVDHLLEVDGLSGPFELEQRAIVYAYADDHLEQLSDAQKQLLRMGPRNMARVVAKLRELRAEMGWPEPAPVFQPVLAEAGTAEAPAEPILVAETIEPVITDSLEQPILATESP